MIASRRYSLLALAAVVALCPIFASAANTEVRVLFDVDNNVATGCTVGGMSGVDQVLVTQVVDTDVAASVTQTHRLVCSSGILGAPSDIITTGWAAGWQPSGGMMLIETRIPFSAFGSSSMPTQMRVGFDGTRGAGAFSALTKANGDPILLPVLSHRRRAVGSPDDDRMIVMDGLDPDWGLINPLTEGTAGGGASAIKLIKTFGFPNPLDSFVYFRFDLNLSGSALLAVDDLYTRTQGQSFTQAAPGVLGNDQPNSLPLTAAKVSEPNDGSVILNPDGSFTFTPFHPSSLTTDSFQYRAVSGTDQSNVATVRIKVLNVNKAPVITTAATNQAVCSGATATFTAAASGTPTPTVQWSVSTDGGTSFNDIPGATTGTLSFVANSSQNGYQYRATFTNSLGNAQTTATLTVTTPPVVTTNPVSQTLCAGTPVVFTAAASGIPAPSVQWQVNSGSGFADMPGQTNPTLTFVTTVADNARQYRAVFTNACGTATSTAALLTVNPNPTPTITPTPAQVCANSAGNTASGPAGVTTYAWSIVNGTITSATNIQNITYTAGASGTVGLTLVVTNASGCSANSTSNIPINANPTTPAITPTPAQVCASSVGNTASGPAGAATYAWSIVNGTITSAANIQNITYTAGASGTVGLTLVVTNASGCSATNSVNVTINANPTTPTITPTPAQVCASSTGNTASGPAGATTYAWSIVNGTITSAANLQNITYTAGASGTVGLTLVVTNASGCSATNTANVPINANPSTPTITPAPAQVCAGSTGNTANGPAGATSYAWSIVNGTITSATNIQNITYTAGATGTVDLTLVVTNASGCSATNTVNVTVNPTPATPTITPTPAQVCANSTGNTAAGPAGATTYAWTIVNGTITSATNIQNITYTAGASGTVDLTLVVTNGSGCAASNTVNVTINANPTTPIITPTPAQVCASSTGNTASGPAGAATYAWSIVNGTITSAANIQNITYTAGASGTVDLTLVVTNASGCSAANTVNVTINPNPSTPTITPTPAQVCGNSTGNTAAGPAGATTYAWSIVNGTITSATNIQNITYTAGASGTVDLTLVVTNASGCSASNTVNVTINPSPSTPTITPTPAQVCAGSVGNTASGPAGATTYAWSIVNGTITSATNIQTITYTAGVAGTVDLTLVVTNGSGCAASNTVNVVSNANPATPTITPTPAQVCATSTGNTAAGPAGATTYAWSIVNGTITSAANIQTITYTAGASGTVDLTLVVTNGSGCSASNTVNVTINANPTTPTITPTPAQVCANSAGNTAAGPAGAASYAWSIVNGTITSATNIQNITYTAGASGTVDLTLVVTNASGCSASNTVNVTINPSPAVPTITPTPAQVCANSTGNTAAGPAGATSYAWSIVNGTITSATNIQTITYTAGASGTVDLTLVVTNAGGCPRSNTVNVTINANPATPTITPTPAQVCANSVGNTASGPAGATSYAWSIVNGTITSATNIQNITYTAGPSGTVDLTLVVTNASGCSATNTVNVTINANPSTPTITPTPAQVCANSTGNTASGPAGATSYAWSIVNGTITSAANIQNITYTAGPSGTVGLTLVVTNASGCAATNTVNVTINANPTTPTITPTPAQVCANSVGNTASGPAGATSYAWSIVNGTITSATNIQNITYTAGASGTVDLTLVVTNGSGCAASNTVNVTINATPAAPTITPTPAQVCANSTGNTASGPAGAATYAWSIVNGSITSATNIQNITYTAGASGTVGLTLVVTNGSGCSASNTVNVTINANPTTPTITPTPAQVCANSVGNTAAGPAGATTYAWSIVNGTITSATNIQNITYTAGASGTVDLTLVVTNGSGCAASNTVNVAINATPATPTITPTPAQVCANSTGNTASGPAGATTYAWSIVNGSITSATNIQNITYTAGASGTVGLTLVVTNASGCSASNTVNVTINANPTTPTITPTPAQVCASSTGNSATGPAGAATYAWSIVNGTITSATNIQTITYTAGASGTVGLTLVVTNGSGCAASNTVNVTINANPATPTITPTPTTLCPGSVGNTAAGPAGATTYAWSIVNGTITSATNIQTITYTAGPSGTVDLTLVVTNASGCSATNTVNVAISNTAPVVTTHPLTQSVQAGNTATFTAAATGTPSPTVQWEVSTNGGGSWNPIGGETNTTLTFTAQLSQNGNQYRAVFTNACGTATTNVATLTVTCPTFAFAPNGTMPGAIFNTAYSQNITVTGTTGAVTIVLANATSVPTSFTFTDNGNGTATVASANPTVTGNFTFDVKATDASGCSTTKTFTFAVGPKVTDDTYSQAAGQTGNAVGNTQAMVSGYTPAPAANEPFATFTGTVLANDAGPGGTLTVTTTTVSNAGGSITFKSTGEFLYTPAVSFSGTATFAYTVSSNGVSSSGNVNIVVSNKVWYVRNDFAGAPDGRSNTPFATLAAAQAASAAGDIIYVGTGNGTTSGQNAGIVLKNTQQLIGNGVALVVNNFTLAAAGTKPQITNATAASDAVTLADGNTVKGLTITGATRDGIAGNGKAAFTGDTLTIQNNVAAGLHLTSMTGTVTVTNTTISGNATGLDVNNGTAVITLDNTNAITSAAGGRTVSIQNRPVAAGAITIGAAITDAGTGILVNANASGTIAFTGTQTMNTTTNTAVALTTNTGTTINFSGTLAITTSTGSGFVGSGGGTLNVSGTANITTGAAGAGLSLNGVTVGGSGVTFNSVNATGPTTGIALTAVTGLVTVNGGTINNAGTGISLQGASTSLTIANVTIGGTTTNGITNTTNFGTLTIGASVNVTAVSALNLTTGTVSGTFANVTSTGGTNGVNLNAVTGNWGATAGALSGATGTTFNVSGGSGTITWGPTISQANGAAVVSIAGSNSGTINFGANVTASGTSTGISIGTSSGTYNFNGAANSITGSGGGISIANASGTVTFSAGTNINTTNTATASFNVATSTANITYGGTITQNANGGKLLNVATYGTGTLTMNGSSLSGTVNGINGVISTMSNVTSTVVVNNLSLTSSNNNFANTLVAITGVNTGGSITFNHLTLSATGTGHTGKGLTMVGGGTLTITATGGASSIDVGSTALDLNGVALGASAIGTLNSLGVAANNGVALTNVTGGTLTIGGGTITGNTAAAFLVSGGSVSVTDSGNINQATAAQPLLSVAAGHTGTLTFNTGTLSATNGTGLLFDNADGTYNFNGTTTLNGGDAGVDILNGSGGTFNFPETATVTNPTGNLFNINASAPTFTYSGSFTKNNNSTIGINVTSNTGGSVTFNGDSLVAGPDAAVETKVLSTGTANAVNLTSNAGMTMTFSGSTLNITTSTGKGFNATGAGPAATTGGTVTVTGTVNTITTTGAGTGLYVEHTTIGAGGLTFQRIQGTAGPVNGIYLNNTGATAGLTVTGTGVDDSGGVITNATQDGIFLSNTRSISLTEMAINTAGQSFIDASNVNGLTITGLETDGSVDHGILGNMITNLTISGSTLVRGGFNAGVANKHGVFITNLRGTSSVTNTTFQNSNTIQMFVLNNTATVAAPAEPTDVLTVSGTTWNTHTGPFAGDHLSVQSDTGGNFKLVVDTSVGINQFTTGGIGVQAASSGSGTVKATITGVKTTAPMTAGVVIGATGSSNAKFDIFSNKSGNGTGFSGMGSVSIAVTCITSGTCNGFVRDNTVTHTAGAGVDATHIILQGNGTVNAEVFSNVVSGNFQRGFYGSSGSGSGKLNLNFHNNNYTGTANAAAGALQGIYVEAGNSSGGPGSQVCLDLAANSFTMVDTTAYRLRNEVTAGNCPSCVFELKNYAGGGTDTTAIGNWITNPPNSNTFSTSSGTPISIGTNNPYSNTAGCTAPSI